MTTDTLPFLEPGRPVTGDWHVLPGWLPVPGLGSLPVNAFLLRGLEPMLVDTGLSALSEDILTALETLIDPTDLKWIWLSHTDADHIGSLDRVLSVAPNARVITNFLGAGKMGMLGVGDPGRMLLLEPGQVLEVGGRKLHQVKPPYYDAPETIGFFDAQDRVLFAADAFGALLPEPVSSINDVSERDLRDGLVGWSSIDAPWLTQIDRLTLGKLLDSLDGLAPKHVLSGHLPVSRGIGALTAHIRAAYGHGTTDAVPPETIAQVEAAIA